MRSVFNERASFKTEARGSRLEAVASAYTSHECAYCGFTAEKNRAADHLPELWHSRYTADGNAAKGILKRFTDPEMKPGMNKFQIKRILDNRNANITGATLGAGCEVNELSQSFAIVNGQTPV